jgi:hypothetical protein
MPGSRSRGAWWLICWVLLAGAGPLAAATPEEGAGMTLDEMWKGVEERIDDQRYEAAAELTGEILERSRAIGDEASWTRA